MSEQKAKRWALVGTGSRGVMYRKALSRTFAGMHELVAASDINPLRAQAWIAEMEEPVPFYAARDFEKMIREEKVEGVVVTTVDRTHDHYICKAMELGCDVITEKPLTIDRDRLRRILETQQRTGRKLTVTFNYRYAPRNAKVKELLQSGAIGGVISVHFEWLLATTHGADYFRRWHRDKRNSGGLLVHKSTHHFDLVNWWINSRPLSVYAEGDLRFYGRENAEARGETAFYERAHDNPVAAKDPFALHLKDHEWLKKIYLDAEAADGYQRDQSVFGSGISIEDDLSLIVRYQNRATMTYHLTAFAPWEGFRVAFNGTHGRLEYDVVEKDYVSGNADDPHFSVNVSGGDSHLAVREPSSIRLQKHWQQAEAIEIEETNEGGHGGGDQRMLEDIFNPSGETDPLGRAAGLADGAFSILVGMAGNASLATGKPVSLPTYMPEIFPNSSFTL